MSLTLPDTPVLETERLILRAPVVSDLQPWSDFLVSDRGTWVGGGPDEGLGRAWRIVAAMFGHWQIHGFGLFVVTDRATGRPLASIGPWYPGNWPEREIGWTIWSAEDEGKGYAAEAARAVIRHCFHDLGWDTLVSYIDAKNAPSIALAERLRATRDDAAERPDRADLVYRHPRPAQ